MKPWSSTIWSSTIRILAALLCAVGVQAWAGPEESAEPQPELAWPAPRKEHRPGCYWWWPGSAVDRRNITWNLETLHRAGIGGVHVIPIYGVKGEEHRYIPYLSPKWLEMLDHAVTEAERLGMWVDMSTGTGWPFGGPHVPRENGERRLAVQDGKITSRPISWRVKRAAPGGVGEVLNPFYLRGLSQYLATFDKAFASSGIKLPRAQYHDSFEYRSNWCPDFLQQFQKRRGYDLNDHASALSGKGDAEIVRRVAYDCHKTLGELHLEFIEAWVAWAHKHGCITRNQAHGAPANLLDLYAAADVPETEVFGANRFPMPGFRRDPSNVRGELPSPLVNRMASSAAHVSGKRLVASETCTWLRNHFRAALSQVKPEIDRLFLAGINHVFFHGCCYSPKDAEWPGWLFYASLEANPRNAFWRDIGALNAYIARCQSILQSAAPDNDILLYWPIHDTWSGPRTLGEHFNVHQHAWLSESPCGRTAQWLVDRGYTFDFISDRLLRRLDNRGGVLAAADTSYRAVLVPAATYMPAATMQRLADLASGGATILFRGQMPEDVPGLAELETRRRRLKQLLASLSFNAAGADVEEAKTGRGRILLGSDLEALLRRASVPRETMVDGGLEFIRRARKDGYHYFVANLTADSVDAWVGLGRPAESAVIMDPWSGNSGVAATRQSAEKTEVYLQLQPGETRVVRTFTRKRVSGIPWPILAPAGPATTVAGQWQVEFVDGGPELPAAFETTQLKSWTVLGDDEARRFAGTARYRIAFTLPEATADDWRLDLGDVRESARVFLNGKLAGTLASIPFNLTVGQYLKPGKNVLEVEVTNLSANRIRDLDLRKVQWKKFHDINFVNHNYGTFDASKWPLTESGLLGPVKLTPMKRKMGRANQQ